MKLLEENTGDRTLSDINHSNIFLDLNPRVMKKKKGDLIKLNSFCTKKEIMKNPGEDFFRSLL